jgi:hypothetical protein
MKCDFLRCGHYCLIGSVLRSKCTFYSKRLVRPQQIFRTAGSFAVFFKSLGTHVLYGVGFVFLVQGSSCVCVCVCVFGVLPWWKLSCGGVLRTFVRTAASALCHILWLYRKSYSTEIRGATWWWCCVNDTYMSHHTVLVLKKNHL